MKSDENVFNGNEFPSLQCPPGENMLSVHVMHMCELTRTMDLIILSCVYARF